ncbi:helix-turn-helix domain-containing protein [Pedobacter nanyangensis]|uniref:helix-turn-helix domain-containing protein n=1 Tax=Pedobacter nanyangensis TaxID=1562389 RepID=UPI000DE232CE|nr:helix-turn-helix domain-containing protein [Pedobacter nanyangensis]
MMHKVEQKCLEEGLINGGNMNVLTSAEIKPFMIFNEPFRSNSFAVIVVQKGSFVFQSNFVKNCMTAKDVYLVTPGSLCELYEMSDDFEFISMGFKKEYLKEQGVFLNGAEIMHLFSTDLVHKFSLNDDEFGDLVFSLKSLKKKINLPDSTPHFKDVVRHSFISVLYEILIVYSKYRVFIPVKLNRQEELTTNFLNLLSENFKSEKRVQHYAKQLFVTSRHLSQVVKAVTGKTAGEIIDEMVINEAKVLLSSHLLNVSQVADELRFSDQSFFGKFFKKYTGVSPSVYKSSATVAVNPPF